MLAQMRDYCRTAPLALGMSFELTPVLRALRMTRTYLLLSALLTTGLSVSPGHGQIVGACKFDIVQLTFLGTPDEQASCLLRAPRKWGHLSAKPAILPDVLKTRIGHQMTIATATLRNHLHSLGLTEPTTGGSLDEPLSRARDNDATAPTARYFVIHDTSAPYFGNAPFPRNIDIDRGINRLDAYAGPDAVAHAFINRTGHILIGHPFSTPWRATQLESQVILEPSKGLFIHVENIQPRRRDQMDGPKNDAIAPVPGFSEAQYRSVALLYVVASVRAGRWLIPAFHAPIDEGLPNAHDDPQNFDLGGKFAPALRNLIGQLTQK